MGENTLFSPVGKGLCQGTKLPYGSFVELLSSYVMKCISNAALGVSIKLVIHDCIIRIQSLSCLFFMDVLQQSAMHADIHVYSQGPSALVRMP